MGTNPAEELAHVALLDRTYQASGLAGSAQREFIDRATYVGVSDGIMTGK